MIGPRVTIINCRWHGEEIWTPDHYRTCAGCGHVFQLAEDLLASYHEMVRETGEKINERLRATSIKLCPLCKLEF